MNKSTATPLFPSSLDQYIRPKQIISLLCRYRIKCAQRGRKKQLLQALTNNTDKLSSLKYKDDFFDRLCNILPPRRKWKRPLLAERVSVRDSILISQRAILNRIKTTHTQIKKGYIQVPNWYSNLNIFLKTIKNRLDNIDEFCFERPVTIPIFKEKNSKGSVCRPITIYGLEDRIIQSLTSRYLLNKFDSTFFDSSFAFRPIKFIDADFILIKHHHAIESITKFKALNSDKDLWVAECDINKFFDCVNHNVVMKVFKKHFNLFVQKGVGLDSRTLKIMKEYLKSFSFTKNVLELNKDEEYFKKFKISKGYFDFPLERLRKNYYYRDSKIKRPLGIPQGGAISCFIANLLLHEVDCSVLNVANKKDILYLRYCDDMMIFHSEEKKCIHSLLRYIKAARKMKLLIHTPVRVEEYNGEKNKIGFWKQKSKLPYKWGAQNAASASAPWIGFVGYQLKYDGSIRVRKKSLGNEVGKQNKLLKQIIDVLKPLDAASLNIYSKKTFKQHIRSLESRYISMSVGKVNLYDNKCKKEYCWASGFTKINRNESTTCQLRNLDRNRNRRIYLLQKKLKCLTITAPESKSLKTEPKFYGAPFSYFHYLSFLETAKV